MEVKEWRIAVAIERSEESMYALSRCLRNYLGRNTDNTTLILLYAKLPSLVYSIGIGFVFNKNVIGATERHNRDLVDSVMERVELIYQNFHNRKIGSGDARDVICEMAEKVGADILIMGTHGRGFINRRFFLCIYGTVATGLVLAGELKERQVIYILTVYYGIENSFDSLSPYVVQWLLASYNTQILLMVFLAVVSLLLAGFFGYHAHLCLANTTTNETFKWQDYISWKRKSNEAKARSAALTTSISTIIEKQSLRRANGRCSSASHH